MYRLTAVCRAIDLPLFQLAARRAYSVRELRAPLASAVEDAPIRCEGQCHGPGEGFVIEIDEALARTAGHPMRYPVAFGEIGSLAAPDTTGLFARTLASGRR